MSKPTAERVRELLDYCPESGLFVWKKNRGRLCKTGQIAGTVMNRGYVSIGLDGKSYMAHRLAWLCTHGDFPPAEIDHVNGIKSDNRIVNLRPATRSENTRNCGRRTINKAGWCGVHLNRRDQTHTAAISLHKTKYTLGNYHSPEIAAAVYNHVCQQVHGDYAKPDIPDWLIPDATFVKAIGGNMKQISKALAAAAIQHAQQQENHHAQ